MSRILILTGSPRKDGNTDRLAAAFARGATVRHQVEILPVRDYHVNPCLGCNACFVRAGNTCCQKDDMARIMEKLMAADILIIASPVYFYGVSSQLKAVVDRLHTPMRNTLPVRRLGLLLVGAAGLPTLFDSILTQYQLVLDFFHLEDVGRVLVRGAREKGDVSEEDLNKAFCLGQSVG